MNRFRITVLLLACVALAPATTFAQGASLHGFGPISSSMGGAGVALPLDSLNALGFNPALVTAVQGNQISFTSEFFKDDINIKTTFGSLTGEAHPTSHLAIAPSFGLMLRDPRKKMALGFGLIAVAGFGTDYPQDNGSILFSQPPRGFGRIYTGYQVTKIPIAFGFALNPKLSVGVSANVYVGQFYVAPLPDGTYDTSANGDIWYPEAGKPSQKYAFAPQLGITYQVTKSLSVGGSYTFPQNYSPYEYNSTISDPSSRNYGLHRTLTYDLDGPQSVDFGVALHNGKMGIAVDGMYTHYVGVHGFGGPGGIVNGTVDPFGWRNVWTIKGGVQADVTPKLTVRGGYNYSQMPLRGEVVISATGAPATFEHHITGGAGIKLFPFLTAEAAAYYVPRSHVTGPFPNLQNVNQGALDESNTLMSALIGLNFKF